MSDLTDKERQIAAAALAVFSRYGLKRATMNDVAEEAGVVRQTLYNVFANKDEVIHGTLLFYCETLRNNVRSAWEGVEDLSTRLDLFFEHYILASYDTVQAAPDAGDLEGGTTAAAKAAMKIANTEVEAMLRTLFVPYREAIDRNGQNPDDFPEFVAATATGLKHSIGDRDVLLRHLEALKSVALLASH